MIQIVQIDFTQIGAIAAAAGSVVSTIILLNRKVIKPMRQWFLIADRTHKIVSEQLSVNGGKSLKDIVLRLEESQARQQADLKAYFALMTSNTVAMFEADLNGRYTAASGLFKAWTGSDDDELLGEAWIGCIAYADRSMVASGWANSVRDRRDFESYHRMIDGQGKVFYVHCYAVPRRFQGHIYGYLGRIERHQPGGDFVPTIL